MTSAQDSIFDVALPRTRANHRALTPLDFLSWSASVFPERTGVVYGAQAFTWGEVDQRCRRLASALRGLGVRRGDTVAVMCPNIPPMLEAHYGIPMAGAVLNALNFRLDAPSIAFMLEHGEAKVLLTDTEFAPVIKAALAQVQRPITVIDILDPAAPGERLGGIELRGPAGVGRPGLRLGAARRRVGRDLALLHLGHHRQPQGRGLPPSRRVPERDGQCGDLRAQPPVHLSVDAADVPLQRLDLHLGGHRRGRDACLPAQGRPGGNLPVDRGDGRDASVRRADRAQHAGARAGRGEAILRPHDRGRDRRGCPAQRRDRGHGADGLPRHPPLRPDRELRPGHGLRRAGGLAGADHGRAVQADGAAGRALPDPGRGAWWPTRNP